MTVIGIVLGIVVVMEFLRDPVAGDAPTQEPGPIDREPGHRKEPPDERSV